MKRVLNFSGNGNEEGAFLANSQEDIDIEMVFVEGGTLTIGCTPEQEDCGFFNAGMLEVAMSDYYIGKYEVTQAQWKAVMGESNNPSDFKGDNLPVTDVSWDEVEEFIHKLNQKTGKNYRLPTEAEWEYAARGGNKNQGYKYSGSNNVDDVAWYYENSGSKSHPVGTKMPNELGIYDMSGNVYEWCSDYDNGYRTGPQHTGTLSFYASFDLVYRGGSWRDFARYAQVSYRDSDTPDFCCSFLGFRLAHSSE